MIESIEQPIDGSGKGRYQMEHLELVRIVERNPQEAIGIHVNIFEWAFFSIELFVNNPLWNDVQNREIFQPFILLSTHSPIDRHRKPLTLLLILLLVSNFESNIQNFRIDIEYK